MRAPLAPAGRIDVEWRPRQQDRLELVTPEGEVQASVHVDGWTVTVAVRDAVLGHGQPPQRVPADHRRRPGPRGRRRRRLGRIAPSGIRDWTPAAHRRSGPRRRAAPQLTPSDARHRAVMFGPQCGVSPHRQNAAAVFRTRFPRPFPARPNRHRVSAGQKPGNVTANLPTPHTPTGYEQRAPDSRFRRSDAPSCTWWQVKDSNLRSFRDGFTDRRMPPAHQQLLGSPANFAANSPQTLDVHRRLPAPPDTASGQAATRR